MPLSHRNPQSSVQNHVNRHIGLLLDTTAATLSHLAPRVAARDYIDNADAAEIELDLASVEASLDKIRAEIASPASGARRLNPEQHLGEVVSGGVFS